MNMKKEWLLNILQMISLISLLLNFYFKMDWLLITTTILIAISVILNFYFLAKRNK